MAKIEDRSDTDKKSWADWHQADSLETLDKVLADTVERFGFRYYKVYKEPIPQSTSLRDLLLISNLPDAFYELFDRIGYSSEELAQMRQLESSQLTQWTLDQLLSVENPAKNTQLIAVLQEFGISRGVYVNIAPVDGSVRILGFFGRDVPLTAREAERLTVLGVEVLDRIGSFEKRRDWDDAGLTSLEMECLLLSSQGHEAHEIGRRLGLSGRTALYLSSSVCSKLKVATMEQAVAEALRCGFIG